MNSRHSKSIDATDCKNLQIKQINKTVKVTQFKSISSFWLLKSKNKLGNNIFCAKSAIYSFESSQVCFWFPLYIKVRILSSKMILSLGKIQRTLFSVDW